MPLPADVTGDRVPVPPTPFPVPATGVIYLSTSGNDANLGLTPNQPKRTLFGAGGAYSAVGPGGTIVVDSGVYEEGYVNDGGGAPIRTKRCTIQAAAGAQVWFDGSTRVTAWGGSGPWTHTGWTFNAGNTSGFDSDKPTVPYSFDQLFYDGKPLQRISAGTPGAGQFRVDGGVVTLGSNPAGHDVRMSRYRTLMVASAIVDMLGIGVRRYANGARSDNEAAGATQGYEAIYYGGTSAGSRIAYCAFVDHGMCPLSAAKAGFEIEHNLFVRSGRSHAQIGGSTGADGLRYNSNFHDKSNLGRFPAEPTAGAVKIVKCDSAEVMDNVFHDHPDGHMLWFDQTCTRVKIAGNKCYSTPGRESKTAILWEVSGGGLFDGTQHWAYLAANETHGLFTYNAITLLDAEWTKVYGNRADEGDDAVIMVRQDSRPNELTAEVRPTSYHYGAVSFRTNHIELANNDMGVGNGYGQLYVWQQAMPGMESAGVVGDTMVSKCSGNWFRTPRGTRNGSPTRAAVWGLTPTTSKGYDLIPAAAGAAALDSRPLFVQNGWRNFQGPTPPLASEREPIPADVQAVLDRLAAVRGTSPPPPPPPPPNVAPTAGFVGTVTGLRVDLTATGSTDTDGTIVSHRWGFGDGTTGTGAAASHTYTAAGTYTVTLTVTDDGGATGTRSAPFTVTAPPPPRPLTWWEQLLRYLLGQR